MSTILKVTEATKKFSGIVALDAASIEVGEREGADPVRIAGRVLVAPVADHLLDIALGLLATGEAVRGNGGLGLAHLPCAFSLASSRGNIRRALPSKIAWR